VNKVGEVRMLRNNAAVDLPRFLPNSLNGSTPARPCPVQ
jgi:hypothetical protein